MAKVAFERFFLRKVRTGKSDNVFENAALHLINTHKLKA